MNPHQKNKIDMASLSEEEQKALRLYGKLPTRKDLLQNKLKERKYFDSGDYALSKAGKASSAGVTEVGSQHPSPENIPHLTSMPSNGGTGGSSSSIPTTATVGNAQLGSSSSPVKESSFLHRETSVDDVQTPPAEEADDNTESDLRRPVMSPEGSISPPAVKAGIPMRWQSRGPETENQV